MFAKLTSAIVLASALVAGVSAKPLPLNKGLVARGGPQSFNNWGGISSLSGFDNFYGSDNFAGSIESQTVVENQEEVVCHSESVTIIQQRLLVLQEMAKRIITEQICEVETQTVVFQQFTASFSSFSSDLSHTSGRSVGYDSGITSHFGDIEGSDGSLTSNDLGFSGQSAGSQTVVPSGNNWNAQTSPSSVGAAYSDCQAAISASQ